MTLSFVASPRGRGALSFALLLAACLASGCDDESLSPAEETELSKLGLAAAELPTSPTNRFADDAAAAAIGQKIFFERRLSSDGTVACVDCHHPDDGLSDDRRVSRGVDEQRGRRHAMPIGSAALMPFLLWDGRAATVWRQPLFAIENEREMNFTRTEVAHFVADQMKDEYEAVFGPMPSLANVAKRALPGDAEWEAMPEESRDAVQRIFVNVGKAVEAYERKLTCTDTRFDRWTRDEETFDEQELDGAAAFLRSGCNGCHNGPAVSDGAFHNLGLVETDDDDPDEGREEGLAVLTSDPLNAASAYSDDPVGGAERIAAAVDEGRTVGSFRTPSLRGVGQRGRFGHRGAESSLEEFIRDTYIGRGGGGRGNGRGDDDDGDDDIVGSVDPLREQVELDGEDVDAIVAFLRTMDCNEIAPELLTSRTRTK